MLIACKFRSAGKCGISKYHVRTSTPHKGGSLSININTPPLLLCLLPLHAGGLEQLKAIKGNGNFGEGRVSIDSNNNLCFLDTVSARADWVWGQWQSLSGGSLALASGWLGVIRLENAYAGWWASDRGDEE